MTSVKYDKYVMSEKETLIKEIRFDWSHCIDMNIKDNSPLDTLAQ